MTELRPEVRSAEGRNNTLKFMLSCRNAALASGMRISAVLFAALVLPIALAAQATVTVPVQDPVYRDLDRLFGSGLIKTMMVGQRPYSRREIARIAIDAS